MPRSRSREDDLFAKTDAETLPAARREHFPAEVSPEVLRWARETIGLELGTVSKRFAKIDRWERGTDKPTVSQLERLSDLYKRPLATFFLPSPPTEAPLPKDFRVLPSGRPTSLTSKVRFAIRTARRTQRLYGVLAHDLHEAHGVRLTKVSIDEDPEACAERTRRRVKITQSEQLSWRDEYAAWRAWRAAVEALGVLVLQLPIPVSEARGFSLADGPVPTVVVSSSDAVTARIFTLSTRSPTLRSMAVGSVCLTPLVTKRKALSRSATMFRVPCSPPLSCFAPRRPLKVPTGEWMSSTSRIRFRGPPKNSR